MTEIILNKPSNLKSINEQATIIGGINSCCFFKQNLKYIYMYNFNRMNNLSYSNCKNLNHQGQQLKSSLGGIESELWYCFFPERNKDKKLSLCSLMTVFSFSDPFFAGKDNECR